MVKIPQKEIDVVTKTLVTTKAALEAGRVRPNPDLPITVISNPFGEFGWLKYHTTIQIGGALGVSSALLVVTNDGSIVWKNKVVGGREPGWHQLSATQDEIIAPV